MLTALLITTNRLTYVWSVANNHIVNTSLGYYINPLMNVVLGVFVLRERLTGAQWIAVTLAAIAVLYLGARRTPAVVRIYARNHLFDVRPGAQGHQRG